MFIRSFIFFFGVLATVLLGWAALVGVPDFMISEIQPPEGLQRYTDEQLYGRSVYIREGCMYCHSQQVRPEGYGSDQDRFWGRPSVPADYVFDKPHLLGTMRTGPDLMNIGVRQSSEDWHLMHLYNPRIVVPGSIMPPFPWLFEEKLSPGPKDKVLALPDSLAPQGKVIIAGRDAIALTEYLLSLNRSYPVAQGKPDTTAKK
ncbi:MAG: cbb3-type cytochrome c oxidase subunit II [Ignavibacteriae bacterium]|nr:cbb3-type cytochrome c oxidase subunit II [Ignavibacteriota bacterium]